MSERGRGDISVGVKNTNDPARKGQIYANARIDVAFKRLLGTDDVVISILNTIVPDFRKDKILKITPNREGIQLLSTNGSTEYFMDYCATTNSGAIVNIEMQNARHLMFDQRALFYLCSIYTGQKTLSEVNEHPWYTGLKKAYSINFLNYDTNKLSGMANNSGVIDVLFESASEHPLDEKQYISHYVMTEKISGRVNDYIQMIQIELPRAETRLDLKKLLDKINSSEDPIFSNEGENTGEDSEYEMMEKLWLTVLNHSSEFNENAIRNVPEVIQKGLKNLQIDGWKGDDYDKYVGELAKYEEYSADVNDRVENGIKEGIKQGIKQGERKANLDMIIKLYRNCSVDLVKTLGLVVVTTVEEVNNRWERLKNGSDADGKLDDFLNFLRSRGFLL